ncbi:hypothetical protein GCM10009547_45660 [Sporichthya brevicatena]|uniref:Uncharacterized protein n=1 Tax=Sporichthya brevicatena TaxID=171442 RepID=A0ABN1HC32_9ACTN
MRASTVGATALAALAAAVVLPVGGATAAEDTQAPKIVSVSAPSIVGLTSKGATFDVTVRARDNLDIARVVVGLLDTKGTYAKPVGFATERVGGQSWDGVFRARITMPTKVPMGEWQVSAFAEDVKGNRSTGITTVRDTFVLKYATRIAGLDVTPEPVRKGSPLTVKGKLQQAVVSGWAPFANKSVAVQFRKAGTSTWTTLATVRSGANGVFSHGTKAKAAGDWRAVHKGDKTRAKATSKVDKVALAR